MIFALNIINQIFFFFKLCVLCVRYELDCHIYDLDIQFAVPEFWTEKLRGLSTFVGTLIFRRRIKSRLPFAGIIRRLPYSKRFQDKG